MDIKKVQEIVDKSQLTDEAKDLIYKMLPEADKPEVREEIMRVIDFEVKMNEAVADEAEEILNKIDDGNKMIDAVEDAADEQVEELGGKADEKFAQLENEKDEIDTEINGLASDDAPVAEPVAPVQAAPIPSWNPTVEATAPVAQPQNTWNQPVTPVAPVQAAPVSTWNQPVEEKPATQPAPFPGTQTGQL